MQGIYLINIVSKRKDKTENIYLQLQCNVELDSLELKIDQSFDCALFNYAGIYFSSIVNYCRYK